MLKLRSRIIRTLVSMLVRFFLRRPGRPSMPNMGEEIEEGLGSMLSTAIVSVTETEKEGINEGSVFGDVKNDQNVKLN